MGQRVAYCRVLLLLVSLSEATPVFPVVPKRTDNNNYQKILESVNNLKNKQDDHLDVQNNIQDALRKVIDHLNVPGTSLNVDSEDPRVLSTEQEINSAFQTLHSIRDKLTTLAEEKEECEERLPKPLPEAECEVPFTSVAGSCMFFDFSDKKSWFEAQDECEKMGASLAVLHPMEKFKETHKYIRTIIDNNSPSVWVGAYRDEHDGTWYWDDRKLTQVSLSLEMWQQGEPNNAEGKEDRAHLSRYNGFYMNDIKSSMEEGLICEKLA